MRKSPLLAASLGLALAAGLLFGQPGAPEAREAAKTKKWTTAVDPKPLGNDVKEGIDWLVSHQLKNGGWGQGEESSHMGGGGELAGKANVADTCMAAMALLRAGNTPTEGQYSKNLRNAIDYVVGQVEASDKDSLYVTDMRGTRVQSKIGTYVDTFMASMLLAEVKDQFADKAYNKRVSAALDKVIAKIESHQKKDGSWDNQGWAPVLTQSIAARGLNRAQVAGAKVSADALGKTQEYSSGQYDAPSGTFKSEGGAGVGLYSSSANMAALQESVNSLESRRDDLEKKARSKDKKEREEAQKELGRYEDAKKVQEQARASVVKQIQDPQFVAGFGSNGGEEFLSYLNISETLVVQGGKEWQQWDQAMTANLSRIQNPDGSWTGHHCITGKTFCTAAALLVLTADRTPVPVASR